jgi:outer membrane receptor for Fe3+-dicitrate
MKKAPMNLHAHGAFGHQLSFLPMVELSPVAPKKESRESLALMMLTAGPLNQILWLKKKRGWRLAVTINNLRNMGWAIQTQMKYSPSGESYAEYRLINEKQRQQAMCLIHLRLEVLS